MVEKVGPGWASSLSWMALPCPGWGGCCCLQTLSTLPSPAELRNLLVHSKGREGEQQGPLGKHHQPGGTQPCTALWVRMEQLKHLAGEI